MDLASHALDPESFKQQETGGHRNDDDVRKSHEEAYGPFARKG